MNRQDIQDEVLSSLPGLSDELLTSLLEGLEELGIESKNDLQFLQEKDLVKYLRPIQCRKLINGWKNEGTKYNDKELGNILVLDVYLDTINTINTV